jgi:hypothetical protein
MCKQECKKIRLSGSGILTFFTAWQVRSLAATTAILCGIYFATYALVWAVITPVQDSMLPEITRFASLLFLPHGIRVLATSLLGGKAVPGLVLGELAGNYFLWGLHDPALLVLTSLFSGSITWVVFEGLLALRINAFYLHIADAPPPFHTLLLAGILSSAANAFLSTALNEPDVSAGHVMSVLAAFMTGDITGLLAVMLAARHVVPLLGFRRE